MSPNKQNKNKTRLIINLLNVNCYTDNSSDKINGFTYSKPSNSF